MTIIGTENHATALVVGGRSGVPAVIDNAGESARLSFSEDDRTKHQKSIALCR